jgi:hypothetical protein
MAQICHSFDGHCCPHLQRKTICHANQSSSLKQLVAGFSSTSMNLNELSNYKVRRSAVLTTALLKIQVLSYVTLCSWYFPTFRKIIVHSSSRPSNPSHSSWTARTRGWRHYDIPKRRDLFAKTRHIPGEFNLQRHSCKRFKYRKQGLDRTDD